MSSRSMPDWMRRGSVCPSPELLACPPGWNPPERIDLVPTNALGPRQTRWFLGIVGGSCFAVALYWTARGFWPVLPFAGLEVGLLALALKLNQSRGHMAQTILVSQEAILVRKRQKNAPEAELVFPRYWTRVKLSRSAIASHPSRLTFESGGKSCEVGEFLTEVQRQGLAKRLDRLIGRMSEAPALRDNPQA